MRLRGIIFAFLKFVRDYTLPLVLLGIFATTILQVYVLGVGPTPQQPPEGYELQRLEARLEWHKGNRDGAVTLEVAEDDPTFETLFMERQVSGTKHTMHNVTPGHTYYWRLKRNDTYSRVCSFKTSKHAIKF